MLKLKNKSMMQQEPPIDQAMQTTIRGAETMALFCRLHVNTRKDIPIRSSEMGMLIYVVKNRQPVTPLMVAECFKVTKPMVTAMTKNLINLGYLIREASLTDKRSFHLKPTDKAIELVEKTYSEYHKHVNLLKDTMGEAAFLQLIQLLDQANQILLEGAQHE